SMEAFFLKCLEYCCGFALWLVSSAVEVTSDFCRCGRSDVGLRKVSSADLQRSRGY
ncbi:hypothetical protein L9F63_009971, partial [Diploptera punctata]